MRTLAALLFVVPYALAQFCGPDEIPDKLAINSNGEVALGCRYNECPRGYNDAGVKNQSPPKCGKRYYELSCGGPLQWVGGIPRGSNLNNVVPLQCCTAQKLRDSPTGQSNKIVQAGQVFEGQVHYDKTGNVIGYDIIKNAQKIRVSENQYAMSVTVSKLMCGAHRREAQFDNPESHVQFQEQVAQGPLNSRDDEGFVGQGFGPPGLGGGFNPPGLGGDSLDFGPPGLDGGVPGGFGPQGFGPPPFGDAGLGGLAAPAAAPAAALAVPLAAGGGGVCFHGDVEVQTPSGSKKMEDLKIGDEVLTVVNDRVIGFQPIRSFLHRLPEKETDFHKISAGGSSVSLTPMHYIYTTPCDQVTPVMKYAKDVVPGKECLIRIYGEKMTPVQVQSNEVFHDKGIYNPMTESGTIVADGFMASVHNVFDDTSFMNTFMATVQNLQKLVSGGELSDNHVELPWALQYAIDYAGKIF